MTWWNPLLWDWPSIAQSILGAGLGAGAVTLYRDRRQESSKAGHLAVRLAVMLEAYTCSCQQFVEANANADHEPDEEFPNWKTQLPELPPYPDDVEGWRSLDLTLSDRCLNLRNRITASQDIISSTIEWDMDSLEDALNEHAAGRGIEAWDIAAALRKKYGLKEPDKVWDYVGALRANHVEALKSKEESAKARAKFAAQFS